MKMVCLMLKSPREGTVKTRLARDIGPQKATAIYRALVERQVAAIPTGWNASIHFAPPDAGLEMETWLKPFLSVSAHFAPQCDGDLGLRLALVVRTAFQRGAKRVFLVGGDCPGIDRDYFDDADRHLNKADVVIGPAVDGGYVLLGIKAPHVGLFENIPWSTSEVLKETIAAARYQTLSIALLQTLEDVDDIDSLKACLKTCVLLYHAHL